MSELETTQQPVKESPPPASPTLFGRMSAPFMGVARWVDRVIPNLRTADAMAYKLAQRTPLNIAVCLVILLAAIIGSRLGIWAEGFLWGIPALGAISLGLGSWAWSTNLLLRPDLSDDARATLKRAIRLQWIPVVASVLTMIYFIGMAARVW